LVFSRWGAALMVAPNIAVTNDHNLNFVAPAGCSPGRAIMTCCSSGRIRRSRH
jgi:hypothetical protein